MMKKVMFAIAMLAVASYAGAASLNADGLTYSADTTVNTVMDRIGLVNDGSFEFGECDLGSAWTCTQNTTCSWILDPAGVWGVAAYDGVLSAWLGGFCGADMNINSFCQDLYIDAGTLNWAWMGHVANPGTETVNVTVNGSIVWSHIMQPEDHTFPGDGGPGFQLTSDTFGGADVSAYCGTTVNLCFEAMPVLGMNMMIDYITLDGDCDTTASDETSISTVKSLY